MTAHHTTETAIEATKLGAYDYLLKPFDPAELLDMIDKAVASSRLSSDQVEIGETAAPTDAIVGNSRPMQSVYKEIGRLAAKPVTVLIRGETGTGKELVARAFYQYSDRGKQSLHRRQLRRHPRDAAGKRTVRARTRRVHRRHRAPRRPLRAGQ